MHILNITYLYLYYVCNILFNLVTYIGKGFGGYLPPSKHMVGIGVDSMTN